MRLAPVLFFLVSGASGCGTEARVEPELPPPAETRWEAASAPADLAMLEAPAHVVPAPEGEARVSAPFSARVLEVHVRPGDRVEVGTPLVDVSMPAVLDAAARWSTSRSRRVLRAARRSELESLRGEGLVESGRVFDQDTQLADLDAERAQALAVLHAASVRESEAATVLRTGRVVLRSPIAGVVRGVDATLGETREPAGAALVHVVADVAARVEARFAQEPPDGAHFTFRALDGTDVTLGDVLASVLDPVDGTRVAWLEAIDPAHRLAPGLSGRVVVVLGATDAVEVPTSALINHEQAARRILIGFNVRERDLGSVVREAEARIEAEVPRPRGYRVVWGGQYESLERARARLGIVIPGVLVLILALLYRVLERVRSTVLVFMNVPFAAVGGIIALAVRGMPLSISAAVGFIALSGIAVLNGVVLVARIHAEEESGLTPAEAAIAAARSRLRPVLMTALVAGLGFVPMMLAHGVGAEVQAPLATVVVGGLFTSTLLTLVVLPSLYARFTPARSTVIVAPPEEATPPGAIEQG